MAAPVSIGHIHVHALRLASGAEALVARVLTVEGVAGFGFSFGPEAFPARDMAAWDAAARARAVPLYGLFGKKMHQHVEMAGLSGANIIDPFDRTLDEVRRLSTGLDQVTLLAASAHRWQIAYCASLAGTIAGTVRIAVRDEHPHEFAQVMDTPGIGIDWSIEQGFGQLQWFP